MAKSRASAAEAEPEAPPQNGGNGHSQNGNGANGNGPKSPPVQSFKIAVDRNTTLEAAIWPKDIDGDNGTYVVYSVTFSRSYRDESGNWQNPKAAFFRPHELPLVRFLTDKCYDWIQHQKIKTPF